MPPGRWVKPLGCLLLLSTTCAFVEPVSASTRCISKTELIGGSRLETTVMRQSNLPPYRFGTVLPGTNERHDREYAPALHFSDGTVAVNTELLSSRLPQDHATDDVPCYVAADEARVIGPGQARLAGVAQPRVPGYVVFGRPKVIHGGPATFVVDHGLPAWAVKYITDETARAASTYADHLGPRTLPLIIAYASPGKDAYLWGDHLEGSITLGLYGDWREDNDSQRTRLRDFIDHELFHVWNGRAIDRADPAALLGLEGGADLARMLLAFERTHDTSEALGEASDAMARCQAEQSPPGTLRTMLQDPQPGKVPYDCGMALLFLLTVHPAGGTLDDSAFWRLWKQPASGDSRQEKYTWASMLRAGEAPASPLVSKLLDASDFPVAAGEASRAAGYRTPARESLPAPLASMVGRRMMASIMASDCHGRVGFYSTPEGYQLDDATPACDNLKPKKTVQAIAGIKPSVDPIGLNARIQALCAEGQPIPVTYVDSGEPSRIACPQLPGSFAFFSLLPGDGRVVSAAAASIGE